MNVFKRTGKKRESWVLDYYVEVGGVPRRRQESFPTKRLAELAMAKRRVEIAEGRFLDRKRERPVDASFDEMAARYVEWAQVSKRSWDRDRRSLRYMRGAFGGKRLSEITPFLIERYKHERRARLSPRSVNIELACLRHLINKAIEWDLFHGANPFRSVKLLKENNARMRYLSEEEMARLVVACEEYFRPVVVAALHTGMRKGEVLGLTWNDVDLQNGYLHVEHTKSGKRRDIPISATLKEALHAVRRRPGVPWVFLQKDGEAPLRDIRKPLARALKASGIEGFVFHDLRHTFASWLVMRGVDLRTVQELLGHSRIEMTLRYSHLSPAHKREAVGVMDEVAAAVHGEKMERSPNLLTMGKS